MMSLSTANLHHIGSFDVTIDSAFVIELHILNFSAGIILRPPRPESLMFFEHCYLIPNSIGYGPS